MIVVRDTFQAKYGKAGALVALFKELRQQWPGQSIDRIFTDASGPFDTVVTEATVESVAAWQQRLAEVFPMPEPMPRPTRFFFSLARLGARTVERFIVIPKP